MTKFTLQIESENSDDICHLAILADLLLDGQPDQIKIDSVWEAMDCLLARLFQYMESGIVKKFPSESDAMLGDLHMHIRGMDRRYHADIERGKPDDEP